MNLRELNIKRKPGQERLSKDDVLAKFAKLLVVVNNDKMS